MVLSYLSWILCWLESKKCICSFRSTFASGTNVVAELARLKSKASFATTSLKTHFWDSFSHNFQTISPTYFKKEPKIVVF